MQVVTTQEYMTHFRGSVVALRTGSSPSPRSLDYEPEHHQPIDEMRRPYG